MEPKAKTLAEIQPWAKNPRKITAKQKAQLKERLKEYGDLSGIVFNRTTQSLVGGHQRIEALKLLDAKPYITYDWETPSDTGTVAEGYIIYNGERFAYREVSWMPEKQRKANLIANLSAGEFDFNALSELWNPEDLLNEGFNAFDLTGDLFVPASKLTQEELTAPKRDKRPKIGIVAKDVKQAKAIIKELEALKAKYPEIEVSLSAGEL